MLAQALAECGVGATPELLQIVKERVDSALVVQLEKGKKAKFIKVQNFKVDLSL